MAQYSTIEWTDHTFNPWWGCVKVSPGCEHCYAETWANRYGHKVWGPAKTTPRRMMSADYWKQPIKWNKAAEQAGTRARVFCASMADVFEAHPMLAEPRARLFDLIEQTPALASWPRARWPKSARFSRLSTIIPAGSIRAPRRLRARNDRLTRRRCLELHAQDRL